MSAARLSARARAIVESAPGQLGRDAIIAHVAAQLAAFEREAHVEAIHSVREALLREQLAIARGHVQSARASEQIIERALEEHLAGKVKAI